MFGEKYEIGSRKYDALVNEYKNLFRQYGYTVSNPDTESIMAEKNGSIGAFTIREDGLCAGAFFHSFRKEDLMEGFKKEKSHTGHCNPRMGWYFYHALSNYRGEGCGNHNFSVGEIGWLLKNHCYS